MTIICLRRRMEEEVEEKTCFKSVQLHIFVIYLYFVKNKEKKIIVLIYIDAH